MSGRIVFGDDETTIGFGQVNQPAMFYRRSALAKIGVLDKRLHMCLDLDLWLRFLLVCGIEAALSSDRAWAAFQLHAASKTMSAGEEFVREKRIIYRNLWEQLGLPADDSILPPVEMKLSYPAPRVIHADRCRSCYLLWQADARSLERDYREARRLLRRTSFRALRLAEKWRYLAVAKRLWFRP
jgi:GT2 family glycosyltransferase